MTRLLYSPEWLETQQQFKKKWPQVGWKHVSMKWGIYTVAEWHRISTGSGSERFAYRYRGNGGNLDGQFGALAAWLAIDC